MIDDYTTTFSHYITYTFLFKGWENELFELGSERVNPKNLQLLYTVLDAQFHYQWTTQVTDGFDQQGLTASTVRFQSES